MAVTAAKWKSQLGTTERYIFFLVLLKEEGKVQERGQGDADMSDVGERSKLEFKCRSCKYGGSTVAK